MRPAVILFAAALVLTACSTGEDLNGKELYDQLCASCHGAGLEGGIGSRLGPGSNAHLNLSDDQIAGAIRVGPGAMPSFPRLSDAQVDSLVAYIRLVQQGED